MESRNKFNYCTTELFSIDDRYYALDSENVVIWNMNRECYEAMKYIMSEHKLPSSISPKIFFEIMNKVNAGLFWTSERPVYEPRDVRSDTLIISFPIIHECNLRCRYCYAKSGDVYEGHSRILSREVINGIIHFAQEKFNDIKKIRLEFVSGGEPLLNPDLFFELVGYFENKVRLLGYELQILLLNNGTMLDKNVLEKIAKLNVDLAVSLDGPKEIQDYQRPFANGEGSYDRVSRSIQCIQDMNVKNIRVWIVSVVTAKTSDIYSILLHHKSLGITSAELRVMRGDEPADMALTEANLDLFIKIYDDFAKQLRENPHDISMILNDYDTFGKLIKRVLLRKGVVRRCTAGYYKFSFTADGEIYPCDSFVGHKNFLEGNVITGDWNENIYEEFRDLSLVSGKKMAPCDDCKVRAFCSSDCHFNSYCSNGDIWNKEGAFCIFQKHLIHLAIDLAECIKIQDLKTYKYLVRIAKMQDIL